MSKFDGKFQIKNGKMKMLRLGPVSGQKQTHRSADGPGFTLEAPERRGIWVFPYPFCDAWFFSHRWYDALPKKFKKNNPYSSQYQADKFEQWNKEYDLAMKKVLDNNPIKTFWYSGGFYSLISPNGHHNKTWHYYDNFREWAKLANKSNVYYLNRDNNNNVEKIKYGADALELFIPM